MYLVKTTEKHVTVKHRPTILAIWGKRTSKKSAEVQV